MTSSILSGPAGTVALENRSLAARDRAASKAVGVGGGGGADELCGAGGGCGCGLACAKHACTVVRRKTIAQQVTIGPRSIMSPQPCLSSSNGIVEGQRGRTPICHRVAPAQCSPGNWMSV